MTEPMQNSADPFQIGPVCFYVIVITRIQTWRLTGEFAYLAQREAPFTCFIGSWYPLVNSVVNRDPDVAFILILPYDA